MSTVASSHTTLSDAAPIAEDVLATVLEPYTYKSCRYLVDAVSQASADSVLAQGNFAIAESAYIRSTGHFNAVELVLCFNQLAYSAFAPAICDGVIPAFRGWGLEDYCKHQLSSMFIRNSSSLFKRPIDANKFSARLECRDFEIVQRTVRYLRVPCAIEFWDEHGGSAFGEFELAALNIPG
ncbi:FcoT family thioesterase [Mycobacterium sp. P7213]|uniref:FcoT family thioesterase n=1 Tax=Mycobacterium sp. P7213 TaxID=2478465 RepID=UPI000F63DD82|nr:FcoT family thioesterase [Mycobacterium sp. P7213]